MIRACQRRVSPSHLHATHLWWEVDAAVIFAAALILASLQHNMLMTLDGATNVWFFISRKLCKTCQRRLYFSVALKPSVSVNLVLTARQVKICSQVSWLWQYRIASWPNECAHLPQSGETQCSSFATVILAWVVGSNTHVAFARCSQTYPVKIIDILD